MKNRRNPKSLNKPKASAPFAIPSVKWSHEKEITDIVSSIIANKTSIRREEIVPDADAPPAYVKALTSIATNTWRAKAKVLDSATGEVREEMKRVDRHIEAIYRNLAEVGIVIRDHTGDVYDEGQPMKVVASKPTQGLGKKRVSETLLPSIFWNDRLVQNGEIEIATPLASHKSDEPQQTSQ
jgi:hypothetical protein